jgi:hypothetical protein
LDDFDRLLLIVETYYERLQKKTMELSNNTISMHGDISHGALPPTSGLISMVFASSFESDFGLTESV